MYQLISDKKKQDNKLLKSELTRVSNYTTLVYNFNNTKCTYNFNTLDMGNCYENVHTDAVTSSTSTMKIFILDFAKKNLGTLEILKNCEKKCYSVLHSI